MFKINMRRIEPPISLEACPACGSIPNKLIFGRIEVRCGNCEGWRVSYETPDEEYTSFHLAAAAWNVAAAAWNANVRRNQWPVKT